MPGLFRTPNRSLIRPLAAPAAPAPAVERARPVAAEAEPAVDDTRTALREKALDLLRRYRANQLSWRHVHHFFCLERGVPARLVDTVAHRCLPEGRLPEPLLQYL